MSVLVLLAHPEYERSRANRALSNAVADLDGVTVHDLYETYPDFGIDVAAEQELLLAAETVVLQHPFYWYSAPALVKEWLDLVLEHGWAYGRRGRALEGKTWLTTLTAGGERRAYCATGVNRYGIPELLRPFEQTARLCRMRWLPPFVVLDVHRLSDDDLRSAGDRYRETLRMVRDSELPADCDDYELLNDLSASGGSLSHSRTGSRR